MPPRSVEKLLANVDGMRRLARRLVDDPSAADDVAQDAAVVALTREPRHEKNVRGWLLGIVRNLARERRRKDARRARHEHAVRPPGASPPAADVVAQAAEQKRLIDAVTSLPEPYRRAVWRRYFENKPPRVIAREDDVPVETVRTWLKRAHAMLRAKLDESHDGNRRAWVLALAPLASRGGGGPGLPTLVGGTIMSAKSKAFALAALVLLVGVVASWLLLDASRQGSPTPEARARTAPAPETADATLAGRGVEASENLEAGAAVGSVRRIVGRVLDERGEPLGGAEIRAGPEETTEIEDLAPVARSRVDGGFTLARPTTDEPLRVAAAAPGRLADRTLLTPGSTDPVVLRLPRVPVYHFRVLDGTTDEPIAGAVCETRLRDGAWTRTLRRTTDAQGLVAIASPVGHALEETVAVHFLHPGYRPLAGIRRGDLGRSSGTREHPREIYLVPGTGLPFEVRDAQDRPVEGARVRAWAGAGNHFPPEPEWETQEPGPGAETLFFLGEAFSDAKGRVRLGEAPAGLTWHARAETEDALGFLYRTGRLPRGKDAFVIHLEPAVHVVGRVVDGEGRPVAGASLEVVPWLYAKAMRNGGVKLPPAACRPGQVGRTDAEGRYDLGPIGIPDPPGEVWVNAWRGDLGYAGTAFSPSAPGDREVRVDLTLGTADPRLAVRVVDEDARPIPGAVVQLPGVVPGSVADGDGRAHVVLYAGTGNVVLARATGYAPVRKEVEDPEAELEIVLPKAASLAGRVVDAAGTPHDAYVDVYDAAAAEMDEAEHGGLYGPHWQARATADASGYFQVTGLRPGPWQVDFWYTTRERGKYRTVRGKALVTGDAPVVLTLPEAAPQDAPGAVVYGTVSDEDGRRLVDYLLTLKGADRWYQPLLKGRRYRFESVPPGEYELVASSPDREREVHVPVVVRVGDETMEVPVVLAPTVTLVASVVDTEGHGIARVQVCLFDEDGDDWAGVGSTNEDGRAEVEHLLPGRYRVRIRSAGWSAMRSVCLIDDLVVLDDTPRQTATLRAAPTGTLVTRLDDERFLPWSEKAWEQRGTEPWRLTYLANVEVVHRDGRRWSERGLFRGRAPYPWSLPPGSYELIVTPYDATPFRTTFTIHAGEETEVAISLAR